MSRTSRGRARSRVAVTAAVLFATLGLLAGCGGGDGDGVTRGSAPMAEMDDHEGASPVAEDARHVAVSARSLEFDPDELTVQVGEDIAIVLLSGDSLHDFTIDELDAHVAAEQGATSVGGFRADEPGRYTFYCSVEGHRAAGMEGTLVVEA